ncbi:hypothetical protein O7543_00735 [Solwaraspora sp. WMMA2080]|uniref:hypothetical protein n=1 Tax=unclassified Solwaraspora TaxID=2627926 RepID=UPI00248C830F|nr:MULTISPECIES: hypothetical protein [unclassified Solwaraspora]WBB95048.1 hypothetical protein O7553_16640 [Solwaraspora sp. WMMA2059]WBC21068.1 hypothetical protein O7543_00735 [Solwaraspora sp. WMMA2080]
MPSDDRFDETLRDVARRAGQTGRLAPAADIRRRGETLRRRRRATTAALAVTLVGAVGAGVAAIQLVTAAPQLPVGPAGPTMSVPSGSPSGSPSGAPSGASTGSPTGAPTGAPASVGDDPLLSGDRQVAIVRTDAFESAVSLLDDGPLGEVDGTEGRRLFVIEPAGADTFRIRAAEPNPDGSDACWQVRSSGSDPLTVVAADCVASEPRQHFSISAVERDGGEPSYAISSASAYLQHSATRGLILEELGDATLTTYFRFVDNGPSPG